eukprot:Em0003g1149a
MDRVLNDLKWTERLVYFDDIVVIAEGVAADPDKMKVPSIITYMYLVFLSIPGNSFTDASLSGIGAVLSQCQDDGHECDIAYASRSLSRQEQQYCVSQRDFLQL